MILRLPISMRFHLLASANWNRVAPSVHGVYKLPICWIEGFIVPLGPVGYALATHWILVGEVPPHWKRFMKLAAQQAATVMKAGKDFHVVQVIRDNLLLLVVPQTSRVFHEPSASIRPTYNIVMVQYHKACGNLTAHMTGFVKPVHMLSRIFQHALDVIGILFNVNRRAIHTAFVSRWYLTLKYCCATFICSTRSQVGVASRRFSRSRNFFVHSRNQVWIF